MPEQTITIADFIKTIRKFKTEVKNLIWQQLVKWMYFQFKSEHHIAFGKIGSYGYKIEQKTQQKIPILFLSQSYLKEMNLVNRHKTFILKPLVKISSSAIAQHCPEKYGKEEVQYFLDHILNFIEKCLKDKESIEIDLDILGKICKEKNQLWFQHVIPKPVKTKGIGRSTSIRFFVEKESNELKTKTNFFATKRQGFLPRIDSKMVLQKKTSQFHRKEGSKESGRESKELTKKPSSRSKFLRSGSLKNIQKNQKQSTIGWQMMGAGNDPLKKQHDYAALTGNISELMKTNFKNVKQNPVYNIPIIDGFSRTLACPVATQRQNPMVSARIGSNLTIRTQHFEISHDGIRYKPNITQSLSSRLEEKNKKIFRICNDEQEYNIVIKQIKNEEDQRLLEMKRKNYTSYLKLFDMIDQNHIVEYDKFILEKILRQIDRTYEKPDLVKEIINEILEYHVQSSKKSIIQYILLDPTERERLRIYIKCKSVKFYGDIKWKPQKLKCVNYFNRGLKNLQQNLLKNTDYFIQIQEIWLETYDEMLLVVLPKDLDPFITIDEFLQKQKFSTKLLKEKMINKWIPKISSIYKDQINALGRNPKKCEIFFQSAATKISLQIRKLIENSFEEYKNYLKKFDMKIINPPDTVVFLERTKNEYEKCFLTVRITHKKEDIYFMDPMEEIEVKLLQVLEMFREFSESIPRPQNLITKTNKAFLPHIRQDDHVFQSVRSEIQEIIKKNLKNVSMSLNIYNTYKYVLSETKVIESWIIDGNHDRRQYYITFQKYNDLYDEVFKNIPAFIRMNMVNVDSSELKNYMLKNIQQVIKKMQKSVYDLVMKKNNEIQTELDAMIAMAKSKAKDCQRLVEIEMAVDRYRRNDIAKLKSRNTDMVKWIGITLYNTFYPVSKDDLKILSDTAKFLHEIFERLDQEDVYIFEQRKKLEEKAREDSRYFKIKVKELATEMEKFKDFGSRMLKDAAIQLLEFCKKNLKLCKAIVKDLNERQTLLGMDETPTTKLEELEKQLKPFEELWELVRDFSQSSQTWTKDSIFKLNSDDIDFQAKTMYKLAVQLSNNKLIEKFAPIALKVTETLVEDIRQFQNNIPLITVFSNPGLKNRHFQQIQRLISYEGQVLSRKSNLYLNKVLSMGFRDHIQQLQTISETASKEFMIQITIKKIKEDWSAVQFQMKKYKDTAVNVLMGGCLEEIQALIDDHSMKMITMKGSLYFKTFEKQLDQLDEWLNYTSQMVEFSVKVQSAWMYLQPVMTSPDILKHLSVEGAKFRVVDEIWKEITSFYGEKLLIKQITKDKQIVTKLKDSNANLQVVMKGLNSYLESKRLSFPRFFFLSNEELLQILSQTKDPTKVQPHLKKCFEGIAKLEFEEEKFIMGMYSDENQFVPFENKINTTLARGNVDEWLKEVEERMIKGVKTEIFKSHLDYTQHPRKECLLRHCAMGILTVEMTNWTKQVQISFENQDVNAAVEKTQYWLNQTVQLINNSSLLKKVDIMTLEALIVLSVHNLDIVKNLFAKRITSRRDFEWESQMRYYFKQFQGEDMMKTYVKILNATCDFNHQYLGNTTRLVITPLTDRCYRTLCSAIFLNYGGAPEGPAGTGKTQTVKDLAKALACQCVVFNCSDGLDYKAMGKFFKGLAASGAWSCFDEFNRINLEVLSVVAQQILCIQNAKAKNQQRLFFEDAEIGLKKNANCFITMNPGYAGRSQLPDNLKALFRSVAMMIPDYAMIAEISLYSYGFSDARNLARKIVSTYKLCSEQLSSQEHYDYGMRAVKSVLVAAGNLKRKNKSLNESSLILKAINDVNLAKFLTFDIPLFNGITSDLFKDVECPKIDYEALIEKIQEIFEEYKLTFTEYTLEKIIQIYDMILVRHGLMIVGYPFSGKSTALQILAEALKRCQEEMSEQEVQLCRINPKSITLKQLYGYFDEISHEWFDGVLAVKFRNFASSTNPKRKWLLLDGPVDAVWIENMNTVLDDNKKLCLSSGQIIAMSKSMNLLFEPMDLLAASPATVSRCGMIYMEPKSLGHQVLIQSWIQENLWLSIDLVNLLKQFFALIPGIYRQIETNLKTICFTDIFFLTKTFLRILSVELNPVCEMLKSEEFSELFGSEKIVFAMIGSICTFSFIWSFGACLETQSRKPFDSFLKRIIMSEIIMINKKRKLGNPEKTTLFDYLFRVDPKDGRYEWVKWSDFVEEMPKSKKAELHSITVQTSDTIKYNYFIQLSINNKIPLILCGPTGTGKTTMVKRYYSEKMNQNENAFLQVVFSSRTTCSQVLEQIQSKVDKKGAKNIVGPKKSNMIIYVDDLNMPMKEKYGAQPPIQLLRQLLDQRGFYDLKEKDKMFKRIVDVVYIYSMASQNNAITPRFLRHLNLISIANFDEDNLLKIFSTLLNISFEGHPENKNITTLLKNSIQLYNECVRILKPTPQKSHYIFNLRDLSKFILGICKADKTKVHSENIGRLWGHEAHRIFVDRLLPEDKHMIEGIINTIGRKWGKNMNKVYFSDILSPSHERSYEEINDLQKVNLSVTTSLNNYNLVSDRPMDLVLFNYALEHILIILRIIREPKGHALLVGLGGSGRKSFSYLSSYIAEYTQFNLEITKNYGFTHFREDMKKLSTQIGIKNRQIAFIFSDSQIKDEQFLEDINNILNLGFIPNIFPPEQKIQICQSIRKDAVAETGSDMSIDQLYQFFLKRIKNQLRLILCFSPIGESFRTRMRMFPSLVNCTTIDWFTQWPQEGLLSVAKQFLKQVELPQKQAYIQMFEYLHSNSKNWCEKIYEQQKRRFYVTPTSYIQFITTFKQLLVKKKKQVKDLIYKYENGYSKIIETEKEVEKMQANLESMKPEIIKATEDTVIKMQMVKIQKQQADTIMEQITGEERVVLEAVKQASGIKDECEKQLAVALPKLKAAEQALLVLDKGSISELKSMNNPPIAVRLTLQGLCLLIDPNPKEKIKNEKTLKMQTNWWQASMRLLGNPKLLNQLVNFNHEGLTEGLINNLGKFLNDPNNKQILTVANVAKSSTACQCIIQWVNGIYNIYFVNKKVKPKKQSLKIAEGKVADLNKKLDAKRSELETANNKVEELNYELEWAQKNKQRLEKQYADCELALKRASIILTSLSNEKIRWYNESQQYKKVHEELNKNVFMSAAQLIYFGPFTQNYREKILKDWLPQFKQRRLNLQDDFSLIKTLGDPVKVRSWNLNGLPYDNFSVENALIIYNSRRWPLMIDPQGQANKWLKKQEASRRLKITKPFEDNFIRNLENCIQFGNPVLIQNLSEQINAALTPVLLKQTYKKGATTYLKMGENALIYSQDFFLYMTTKLGNPHYLPEVCTQVVMINFMITEEGLSSQLLALLVSKEKPELQSQKEHLLIESAENQKTLQQIENKILDILSNSENILDDETAINVLSASKQKSTEISEKQVIAKQTEIQIDKARSQYQEVSEEGSLLFFAVRDLGIIDPMYQYSLVYFTDLYSMAIDKSDPSDNIQQRLENLKQYFRISLFRNVGRSLFQKDRLMFSVLLALRLMKVKSQVLQYLIMNSESFTKAITIAKPKGEWINDKLWKDIIRLSQISPFENVVKLFNDEQPKNSFEKIVVSSKPLTEKFPKTYQGIQEVEKLLLYKCFRPDKMIEVFTEFVNKTLGSEFVKSLPFDLSKIYPDSTEQTPILFVLSPGSDPFISITNFAKIRQIQIDSVSLGQGQGPIAERLLAENREKGGWVILQNCHLATSWMSNLEKIVQELQDPQKEIHKNFRMWLTSYPTEEFPQSVLQKSLKITNQPPKGLKNNLMVSYLSDPINDQEYFESCIFEKPFKKLLYSLSFFHAVIQERRKFGPLGWNISYEFNESDLRISCKQLKIYIDNADKVEEMPFTALKYLIAECNYGGRVTDQNDRRLLLTLLQDYFNFDVLNTPNYSFGNTDEFILPDNLDQHQSYINYIDNLPLFGSPELVGLHPNADITRDINESNTLLDSLLKCSSTSGDGGNENKSSQEQIQDLIGSILNEQTFPQLFNHETTLRKYPILYEESMNTVLNQEIGRYNRLLSEIEKTLKLLAKAIKGEEVMTNDLEKMFRSLYEGKIPQLWMAKSYPSMKPLGGYISDLLQRVNFFSEWIKNGIPSQFWLSGFFFTQSFLTGILQNYSRRKKIPVDELAFQFKFKQSQIQTYEDGANVHGLFIEGADWDSQRQILTESNPRQLFVNCPHIYLKPQKLDKISDQCVYEAPLYKVLSRRGTLSTTGHSTNFVMMVKIPTDKQAEHWIKRGVALLTQLSS